MRFPTSPFLIAATLAVIATGLAVVATPNLQTVILSPFVATAGTSLPAGYLTYNTATEFCLLGDNMPAAGPTSAHLVTPSQASQLQTALNTYGVVRLQSGDYTSSNGGLSGITISSNQEIFGMIGTKVPPITVTPGTTNAIVDLVLATQLTFPASSVVTSQNCFTRIQGIGTDSYVLMDGATLDSNMFMRVDASYSADDTSGGILTNNRFIDSKAGLLQQAPISIKGNATNQGDNNVFLGNQLQLTTGNEDYISNQKNFTLLGYLGESWNYNGANTQPMFTTGPMGTFRGDGLVGQQYNSQKTPVWDFGANEVQIYDTEINNGATNPSELIYENTNQRSGWIDYKSPTTTDNATGATRFGALPTGDLFVNSTFTAYGAAFSDATVNGTSVLSSTPTSAQQSVLRQMYVSPPARNGQLWEQPTFAPVPDPAGPTWASLCGSQDDTTAIQSAITNQGVADLSTVTTSNGNLGGTLVPGGNGARYFCISGPLQVLNNHGIRGSGMDKTVIIAKSNTIDMIKGGNNYTGTTGVSIQLTDLAFEGALNGVHFDTANGGGYDQYSNAVFSHVTFRNMANAGISMDGSYGFDQSFFDNVNFVGDHVAIWERSPWVQGDPDYQLSYFDKTYCFHCQFIANGEGLDWTPSGRFNNSNGCIDCLFQDNTAHVINLVAALGFTLANSVLINNGGNPSLYDSGYKLSLVDDYFRADAKGTGGLLGGGDYVAQVSCEGCVFERGTSTTATIFRDTTTSATGALINSKSIDMPLGPVGNGMLLNTTLGADPSLNQQGVLLKGGVATTFLPGTPNPVPQLLWGSAFTTTVAGGSTPTPGPSPTPGPAATPVPPQVVPATLFSDDFEHQGLAPWSPIWGSWSICKPAPGPNHAYCDSNTSASQEMSIAGSSTWTNYAEQATVSLGDDTNSAIQLMGRVQDQHNYYYLELGKIPKATGAKSWAIWKDVNDTTWTNLAQGTYNYAANTPYVLDLTFQGDSITAGISSDNGATWQTLGTVHDSQWPSGRIGVGHWGSTAWFDNVAVASSPLFSTGFESGQPQPTWSDTVDAANGGNTNILGICCGLTGQESSVRVNAQGTGDSVPAHGGTSSLLYSGMDNSATTSFTYNKVFDVSSAPITITPSTTLSYWIFPQTSATAPSGASPSGNNSSCVALDLVFTDGTTLHSSTATDQNGNKMSPNGQCGHLAMDTWDHVTTNVGDVLAGKTIARIDVGYDQGPNTGNYRGYIDDISLSN